MGGGRTNSGLPRTWQQWVSHPIHVNECRMVYEVRNNVLKSPEIIRTPNKHLSPSSQQHRYVLHLKCDGGKICFLSVDEKLIQIKLHPYINVDTHVNLKRRFFGHLRAAMRRSSQQNMPTWVLG